MLAHRLADCTGWDIDAVAPVDPVTVTIIDRRLTSRRHILNIEQIQAHLVERFPEAQVAVKYAEDMDLRDQIQAASTASVFVVMHGAALANFIFLSQVETPPSSGAALQAGQRHTWHQQQAVSKVLPRIGF